MTEEEACKLFHYVMDRATTDMHFRRGLLDQPKRVLEKMLEIKLPSDFNIRFVENKGADLTVVLPDPTARDERIGSDD